MRYVLIGVLVSLSAWQVLAIADAQASYQNRPDRIAAFMPLRSTGWQARNQPTGHFEGLSSEIQNSQLIRREISSFHQPAQRQSTQDSQQVSPHASERSLQSHLVTDLGFPVTGRSPTPKHYIPAGFQNWGLETIWQNIVADHRNFYSRPILCKLGLGIGGAAILANTSLDQDFRDWVQGDDGTDGSPQNDLERLGDGNYVIPALALTWISTEVLGSSQYCYSNSGGRTSWNDVFNQWSKRSLRAIGVGTIPCLLLQISIGASRPGESSAGSDWKPFQDSNGLSGHTFVGAVPWITAARLMSHRPLLSAGFYAVSALPGYQRIRDDRHYLSQVLLGYWLAYLCVRSVEHTEWQKFPIVPVIQPGHVGFTTTISW